ncbi:MAG: DNA-directed RNA polymerase subunit H [Candidatus Geothermarchaeales archaeon]
MAKGKVFDSMIHRLVPKHEILSEAEAKSVVEKYGGSDSLFPYIKDSDPVCKELEAKAGDLMKITRDSRTSRKSYYYRLVIEG